MGTIIALPQNTDRPMRRSKIASGKSAEILFFSGVRYARCEEKPTKLSFKTVKSRSRQAKKLS